MQTITKKYKVYKFNELSRDAKETALEKLSDINVDNSFWYEQVYDDVQQIGEVIGIEVEKIYFELFCQGAGACFEGSYAYVKGSSKAIREYAPLDKELHRITDGLRQVQRESFYKLTADIQQDGHYSHKYCTKISVQNSDTGDSVCSDVENWLSELLRDFMDWIHKQLDKQYDYLTSEEAIIETIEANDYDFFEDGRLFRSCC